jgi:hypothetical protein
MAKKPVKTTPKPITKKAFVGMGETYSLDNETINKHIEDNRIGNYALGLLKKPKDGQNYVFKIKYIGRSDTNLRGEIKQQGIRLKLKKNGKQMYTHFKFVYQNTPLEAFHKECANYHDCGGKQNLDNLIHPARPTGLTKEIEPCKWVGCEN